MGIPVVSDHTKKANREKAHKGFKIVFASSVFAGIASMVAFTVAKIDSRLLVSVGISLALSTALNYYYLTVFRRFASQLQ